MQVDPRIFVIEERLRDARRIIAVASGKGGVGKSLIASLISLMLSEEGYRVGLLDLDFYGPSCHIILGAQNLCPQEERGVIPPSVGGVKLMSLAFYVQDEPLALRGKAVSDAILEMLAITRWGLLDYLIVDMPPGMSDELLDIIKFIRRCEVLLVSTSSLLSVKTVSRLAKLLLKLRVPVIGVIENMRHYESWQVQAMAREVGVKYLGYLPYDPQIENALGEPRALLKTSLAKRLSQILKRITS